MDIGINIPDPVHFLPVGGSRLFGIKGSPYVLLRSSVFDMKGTKVRTLVKSSLGPGRHETVLEAGGLSDGVYFLRLQANGPSRTHRFVLGH